MTRALRMDIVGVCAELCQLEVAIVFNALRRSGLVEDGDGFNMCRMRKHVDGLQAADSIAAVTKNTKFGRERLWVAGDVDENSGPDLLDDAAEHLRRTSLPRRIEDD